jgi:ectoine hydroxylase-related dioxygenase (phytanoyl-CoA dioxygenase family)
MLAALTGAAAELATRGLTVLNVPHMETEQIAAARKLCSARLDSLLSEVDGVGVDPLAQHYTFKEISHRQQMRWDLRLPADDELWKQACEAAVKAATPTLEALHPSEEAGPIRTLISGVLISRPGAENQRWHADADSQHFKAAAASPHCRIYNAFMPLVDVAADSDGTEFAPGSDTIPGWPGAHRDPLYAMLPPPTCPPVDAIESPACCEGGVILADYRTLHRGRASIGRERQVAYVVLAVGAEAIDSSNFRPEAIAEMPKAALEEMPYW